MRLIPVKTRIIKPKDDLVKLIQKPLKNNDILVIASKVLAYSQGRLMDANSKEFDKIVEKEGKKLFQANYCNLTFKEGHLIPNAGVDKSNTPKGKIVLWPKHPFKEAERLQKELRTKHNLRNLGVVISDSTCAPMRVGVHGISIGHFGFEGIEDVRNKKDIFGKPLKVTRRNLADSLADAATILMGESDERVPFVIIREAPVKFTNAKVRRSYIRLKSDLYYGIYNNDFKKFLTR
ncbi:coenzyme F420-0:L-glutamate ligase [Patescibacteria group bacterium]